MKIFSPVFSGEMKEANSSTSPPEPLAILSEDEKALIDKMELRQDGALTVNGVPVDKASVGCRRTRTRCTSNRRSILRSEMYSPDPRNVLLRCA